MPNGLALLIGPLIGFDASQLHSLLVWGGVCLVISVVNAMRALIAENRAFRAERLPKVAVVFEPNNPPYLQELFVIPPGQTKPVWHRIYRVGIRNDSSEVIQNVRVVLESFDHQQGDNVVPPNPQNPVYLEHALNVMGVDNKTGVVDVAPGDRPTIFVDVIAQEVDPETETGDWMSPCYASPNLWSGLFSRSTFIVGLRVEGGGYPTRAKFVVGATLQDRRIKMIPSVLS